LLYDPGMRSDVEVRLGPGDRERLEAVVADRNRRKAEERHASARTRRWTVMTRERPPSIKEAAWEVMEEAYMKASAGGKLPAPTRMIFYAARPLIQEITGEP
jgi:hypothetical protein